MHILIELGLIQGEEHFSVMTNNLSGNFLDNFSNNIRSFNYKCNNGNVEDFWNLVEEKKIAI